MCVCGSSGSRGEVVKTEVKDLICMHGLPPVLFSSLKGVLSECLSVCFSLQTHEDGMVDPT